MRDVLNGEYQNNRIGTKNPMDKIEVHRIFCSYNKKMFLLS